jgi:hypothetical protein
MAWILRESQINSRKENKMKYVIFSIDNVTNTHAQAKFLRHIDTARAMQKMKGNMIHCIGSYKGEIEPSYLMLWDDFKEHVIGMGFVENQESILRVSECNKQYAELVYSDQTRESVGSLKDVSKDEAMKHDAWTYRPDLNMYWITVKGNPDTVHNKQIVR